MEFVSCLKFQKFFILNQDETSEMFELFCGMKSLTYLSSETLNKSITFSCFEESVQDILHLNFEKSDNLAKTVLSL